MLVTRAEARSKWCPMARFAAQGGTDNSEACCQAAACMMWRWLDAPSRDEETELARRGYCGLAGRLEHRDAVLNQLPEITAVAFHHRADDFSNPETFLFAQRLAESGITPHQLRGDVAVADEPIGIKVEAKEAGKRDDGLVVAVVIIEAQIVDHINGSLVPLTCTEVGVGRDETAALIATSDHWIAHCLPAIRRAVDEKNIARPDGYVSHTIKGTDKRQGFNVYNGPVFASERLAPNLPAVFSDNPYKWLASHGTIEIPDGAVHLLQFSARFEPGTGSEIFAMANGAQITGAYDVLKEFPWPLRYTNHQLSWYTVLKRAD